MTPDHGWRLLDTGPRAPADNLALDEALLSACDAEGGSTFRLLQFSRPCALIGFNQAVSLEVREEYCRRRGIEVNRRITGGGAIYCDPGQLGWELIAPKDTPGLPARPEELYALFCEGAVRGLRKLGIEAAFRPRNDIEVAGRKLSGTGGTEKGRAFLFQGTLLIDFDVETMVRVLRVPAEKLRDREIDSVRERVTCLGWELGAVPDLEAVKAALRFGMEELLGTSFLPGGLSPLEETLFRELRPKFASPQWSHHL
ncbi:MAG: lipoate--protein ligase family protein, partial [Deltaproteobacteria bacterium]|nr:lipoate--protein ligase family protein [Deltaproteobacteria bacterium]